MTDEHTEVHWDPAFAAALIGISRAPVRTSS